VIEATDHPPFYRGADVLRRHGWQASAAYWEKNSEQGTEDFDRDLG
jgi:hypothetical protein